MQRNFVQPRPNLANFPIHPTFIPLSPYSSTARTPSLYVQGQHMAPSTTYNRYIAHPFKAYDLLIRSIYTTYLYDLLIRPTYMVYLHILSIQFTYSTYPPLILSPPPTLFTYFTYPLTLLYFFRLTYFPFHSINTLPPLPYSTLLYYTIYVPYILIQPLYPLYLYDLRILVLTSRTRPAFG